MNRWTLGNNELVVAAYINRLDNGQPFGVADIRGRDIEDVGKPNFEEGMYDKARLAGTQNVLLCFMTSQDVWRMLDWLAELAFEMEKAEGEPCPTHLDKEM